MGSVLAVCGLVRLGSVRFVWLGSEMVGSGPLYAMIMASTRGGASNKRPIVLARGG